MQQDENRKVHPRAHATEETFYRGPESSSPLWRRVLPYLVIALMLLMVDAVYAFIQIKTEFDSATVATRTGRQAVIDGDLVSAERAFSEVEQAADAVHGLVKHPGVQVTGWIPLLSGDVETLEALADVADLSQQAGRLAIDATVALGGVERDDFARTLFSGGKVQLAPIQEASIHAGRLQELLLQAEIRLMEPKHPYLSLVDDALHETRREVRAAADIARGGDQLLHLLPELFGAGGEKRYFLAFLSPSEGRGGGGLLGMYAILKADEGELKLGKVKPFGTFDLSAIEDTDAPAWFKARYGQPLETPGSAPSESQIAALLPPGTDPRVAEILASDPERAQQLLEQHPDAANAVEQFRTYSSLLTQVNFSPAFDVVGETILQLYEGDKKVPLDGLMTFDPVALAKLTEATGPLFGRGLNVEVGPSNAVEVALLDTYLELGAEPEAQIAYLASLIRDFWNKLAGGQTDAVALLKALGESMDTTHVRLYAREPAVADSLAELGVSPDLSEHGDGLQTVYHNSIGTRVDYFLDRSIETTVQLLESGDAEITTEITLDNNAPDGPPNLLLGPFAEGDEPGLNRMQLNVLMPARAIPQTFEFEGSEIPFDRALEDGYPTVWSVVEIPAGSTRTVRVSYVVPSFWERESLGGSAQMTLLAQATPRLDTFSLTFVPPPGWQIDEILEPGGTTATGPTVTGLIQGAIEVGATLVPSE